VVLGVLASLAEGIGISLFIPFLQGLSADDLGGNATWLVDRLAGLFDQVDADRRLTFIALCIFCAIVVRILLGYVCEILYTVLDARVGHEMRASIHAQLMTLDYGYLQTISPERLYNTLAGDTWRASAAVTTLLSMITETATLAIFATILVLISWKLTLVVSCVMFLIAVFMRYLMRRSQALGRVARRTNVRFTKRMLQSLGGLEVTRTFGREEYERQRFEEASFSTSNVFARLGLLTKAVNPIYEILAAAILVGLIVVAIQAGYNLPALIVFVFVLHRLQPRFKSLDSKRVHLATLAAPLDVVTDLANPHGKPRARTGPEPFAGLRDTIRFQNVSYTYANTRDAAVHDVSFEIPAGKSTAIVGASGGGKSTTMRILLRLYEPTSGSVLIDGVPLERIDVRSWRDRIAVVSQDAFVFDATVAENIGYGRAGATFEDVSEAAQMADAQTFITALPRGYQTLIGNDGARLSGGQRQRLALARAFVRKPTILILDEATNALDGVTEQTIQKAIDAMHGDCTRIIVAHRMSSVRSVDHVVVIEDGTVAESGPPADLLRRRGAFHRLFTAQQAEPD
jgi:subfamily B ATP-binding cassette protein MsbA